MANASNDDGDMINRRSGKPLGVQNFQATNVRVSLLRIGEYQIQSGSAIYLTAKWYYTRQQLIWEILEIGRKKKIEIDWSIISAIRVAYDSNPKILEIELHRPPRFYGDPELSGCSTLWGAILDFTDGQASTCRIHHLEFSTDTRLEKSMKPLFILDSRLKKSTEGPFPSLGGQFFVRDITAALQAPPPPLINYQLLQHHQIPPNRSSVPVWSSNSNLVDLTSTVRQSMNCPLPSHENSQVSVSMTSYRNKGETYLSALCHSEPDYGNPQSSLSLPRTGTKHDLELRMAHSVPRSRTIHNATVLSYNLDNKSHLGLTSSSNPNVDLVLGSPSSLSRRPMTNDHAGHRPDDERHNKRNNEQLVIMTSNEPSTSEVDVRDGHDRWFDAALVCSPHQQGSSHSSAHGESRHKRGRHT